ncbi:SRA stem-loop-interacting RNA-binding protein, mitochondrial-like [Thalassophryne amazonica]|uniref:SRA stem-loop-interacting RNA-binding protein, mitochondrial-like n=1 Tax=Thalassophryne amazonica TaxID=390379 RepID=UPI001471AF80|nr:SRA stem-loop-interacting RNA-binding protein, mitochondrial-like [Thalassophryne amazonica]
MSAAASKKAFELFVNRVPWTLSANELKTYFGQFGVVKKCILPVDQNTGFHKGFCWIMFKTEQDLFSALEKDRHVVEGNTLLVQRNRKTFNTRDPTRDMDSD